MHTADFIVREPLLDPKQQVLGYELSWRQSASDTDRANETDFAALAEFIGQQLNDAEGGWLLGGQLLFLQASPALLTAEVLQALPPENTVLTLGAADLADAADLAVAKERRAQGYGLCLRDSDFNVLDKTLLGLLTHIEVRFDPDDLASQARIYGALKQSSVRMVARGISTWQQYDSCAALGLDAFVGKLHLTPRPGPPAKGLNPAQTVVLQLMTLVRQNAEIRELEAVLKRDAALSFKLLRYINSAGFGHGSEIHSLRHAVTLLGYAPLFRWLSLLLATASTSGYSPVLMQTAVIRGRLAELLGTPALPRGEAENLFVAGLFSLLDRLLGIPMAEVLEKMQFSEALSQALLSRAGIYGPYLALAEACELNSALVGSLAASLQIEAEEVNQLHLSALAWSHNLQL
jgi:EAL and modified HD-GYP domain-containing signal transduction protein